jgi:hypothetical protein
MLRHTFSNQARVAWRLFQGTVHVAVGFVDLGVLLEMDLAPTPGRDNGPLLFRGYELSAYAVAKTLVVWQMVLAGGPARALAQVWFSTTWEPATVTAFQSALGTVVDTAGVRDEPEVVAYLEHWAGSDSATLKRARTEWAATSEGVQASWVRLERAQCRMAQARYELTGDFCLEGDSCLVGNTTMFNCPDGAPPLRLESVFSCLQLSALSLANSDGTVLQTAESYIMRSLERLVDRAREGTVAVELRHCGVEGAVREIAELGPRTMTWSNVLDFMDRKKFHNLARQCSVDGTKHYGYCMNWHQKVRGTNLIDLASGEEQSKLLDATKEKIPQLLATLAPGRFRYPLPSSPLNTASYIMMSEDTTCIGSWMDDFFGPDVGSSRGWHASLAPLSTTGEVTIYLTWEYQTKTAEKSRVPH